MIQCLIIDDEPLAVELMADNVSRVPFLSLAGTANNIPEAMQIMNEKQVDLIFLDIEMPEISGLSFLKMQKVKPMVIITTAYDKYAIDGYNLDVVDYLLKPISFDRFLKAANKASEIFQLMHPTVAGPPSDLKYIFVKSEHRILKITLSEILYIESMKDYVKIYCGPKPIFSLMSLKQLETLLPEKDFVRIHRSYIISMSQISFIGKSKVIIGTASIPISNFYRDEFFKKLGGNFAVSD